MADFWRSLRCAYSRSGVLSMPRTLVWKEKREPSNPFDGVVPAAEVKRSVEASFAAKAQVVGLRTGVSMMPAMEPSGAMRTMHAPPKRQFQR